MEKLSKVLIFAEKESQFGLLCSAAKSIAEHTAAFAVASAPACPVDKAFVVADQGIVFDDYFETFAAVTAEYAPDAIIVSSEKRMRSIALHACSRKHGAQADSQRGRQPREHRRTGGYNPQRAVRRKQWKNSVKY